MFLVAGPVPWHPHEVPVSPCSPVLGEWLHVDAEFQIHVELGPVLPVFDVSPRFVAPQQELTSHVKHHYQVSNKNRPAVYLARCHSFPTHFELLQARQLFSAALDRYRLNRFVKRAI